VPSSSASALTGLAGRAPASAGIGDSDGAGAATTKATGGPTPSAPPHPALPEIPLAGLPSEAGSTSPFRFFSPSSFWNTEVPVSAPVDLDSPAAVGALESEIAEERQGPGINTTEYSVPIYTVPAGQPIVSVSLIDAAAEPSLQAAWQAVPLPSNAQPAAGTDGHLVVWQPSSNRLWEFLRLARSTAGWHASWGGAIDDVSGAPGVYGPESWPGARSGWGASASSLSIAGGLITLEDLERGEINHALAVSLPDVRAGVYAAPARRTDGILASAAALPEGARLRLDPNIDLASLHLPKLTLMIARAAQRYGIVVRDRASHVTFYAQDPTPTGSNPYAGPGGYFERRTPTQLLSSFPWSDLELLRMELHEVD
jgi:hypothetical protein